MSIPITADLDTPAAQPQFTRLVCVAGCVALSDWLFHGWRIGVSLAIFLAALGIVAIASSRIYAARTTQISLGIVFAAVIIALIEDISPLSTVLGGFGALFFIIAMTAPEPASWQQRLFEVIAAPFRGYFQMIVDVLALAAQAQRKIAPSLGMASLIAWIVPLSLFVIFLSLFASANPLIERAIGQIDLLVLFRYFDPWRTAFWIIMAGAIWALMRRRIKLRSKPGSMVGPGSTVSADDGELEGKPANLTTDLDYLFGEKAMARSLILFNALFLLQTWLDVTYLWGGASLPDGMSPAEYAHRGAYPLIVTALLAAGFVLIAMRPNGPAKSSRLIRPLVLAWTGQNVVLVISSILRLDLYVATFSLTYLRLAALIWMVLVAIGLLLIFLQILLRKSNSWLLSANAASLALVLYGCCFINAPLLIAAYNIEHSREITGKGAQLDLAYLHCLGQEALPAIEARAAELPKLRDMAFRIRLNLRSEAFGPPTNWRAWSFRSWRFNRYLANNTRVPTDSSGGSGQ
ncbi:DUF4173 domain-containing protein [Roseiarcaceae bacterium H3SJ34-1]|uniref:DUF4153 domain-containing protein n=1 Tax=Terripilifer ovatus TaxID=3032367 RepID=UPI003AB95D50|nr:DUF4173 domain-containing protein [Roseiarcaceae bacterium H3SJ34-1]